MYTGLCIKTAGWVGAFLTRSRPCTERGVQAPRIETDIFTMRLARHEPWSGKQARARLSGSRLQYFLRKIDCRRELSAHGVDCVHAKDARDALRAKKISARTAEGHIALSGRACAECLITEL